MALSSSFISDIGTVVFTDATDIDNYFTKAGGQDFVNWFNTRAAGRGAWLIAGSTVPLGIQPGPATLLRFNQLWSNESIQVIFGAGQITLLQFLALQSIIINETGGGLVPAIELVGYPGHPGIAYAFDAIPGLKRSYNTLAGNKTCFTLFNDPAYNKAFGNLPLAGELINTTDQVWAGESYPQQSIPTSTNPGITGYVLEADFFKFRGRGFIQTTGRANYTQLIGFIAGYTGSDTLLCSTKTRWNALSADEDTLASISTNNEWDALFQEGGCLVAGKAIAIHNESAGYYLQQLDDTGKDPIERLLYNMGLRISGADSYAMLFQNRVLQLLELLQ